MSPSEVSNRTDMRRRTKQRQTCISFTSMHFLRDFPPELIAAVVGHLSDDFETLKSCCLSSSIFVRSTQARLFRSVQINYGKNPHNLVKMAPHLISNIRRISFSGPSPTREEAWPNDDRNLPPTLEALARDGSCQVQIVSFQRIALDLFPLDIWTPLQKLLACKSVVHIQFLFCRIPTTLFDHVSSRLMTLEIKHFGLAEPTNNASAPVDVAEPDICLKSLKISIIPDIGIDFIQLFLNQAGRRLDLTGLRELSLFINLWTIDSAVEIDLSQFPHLEHLTLLPANDMPLDELIRWLTPSLRYLNANNHLQAITISLSNTTNAHRSMWRELDSLLAGPPFESGTFRGLIFNRSALALDMTDFDAVAKLLPVKLPRIDGKGLLQVERSHE